MPPERENPSEAYKDWHPGGTSGNGGAKEIPASLQRPEAVETPVETAEGKAETTPTPEKAPVESKQTKLERNKIMGALLERLTSFPEGEQELMLKAVNLDDMTFERTVQVWGAKYPEQAALARDLRRAGPLAKEWLAGRRVEPTAEEPVTAGQDKGELAEAVENLKARGMIQESQETGETPRDYTELEGRYSWQEGLKKAQELYGPDARYPNGEEAQRLLAAEITALDISQAIGAYLDGGEGKYVLFLKTKDGIREIPHTAGNNMEPSRTNSDGSRVEIKKIVIPGESKSEETPLRMAA